MKVIKSSMGVVGSIVLSPNMSVPTTQHFRMSARSVIAGGGAAQTQTDFNLEIKSNKIGKV